MRNKLARNKLASLSISVAFGTALLFAQAPDNTKNNKQDSDSGAITAGQAGNSQGDRDLAQKIRKGITDDKSLSTYAHNIKVIVRSGSVTLRGPVRSDDERAAIEALAKQNAGSGNVVDELTVAPKK
jgi:hyperosmotically inducible periplasmic protein